MTKLQVLEELESNLSLLNCIGERCEEISEKSVNFWTLRELDKYVDDLNRLLADTNIDEVFKGDKDFLKLLASHAEYLRWVLAMVLAGKPKLNKTTIYNLCAACTLIKDYGLIKGIKKRIKQQPQGEVECEEEHIPTIDNRLDALCEFRRLYSAIEATQDVVSHNADHYSCVSILVFQSEWEELHNLTRNPAFLKEVQGIEQDWLVNFTTSSLNQANALMGKSKIKRKEFRDAVLSTRAMGERIIQHVYKEIKILRADKEKEELEELGVI